MKMSPTPGDVWLLRIDRGNDVVTCETVDVSPFDAGLRRGLRRGSCTVFELLDLSHKTRPPLERVWNEAGANNR
jgi:hypothetical protein